MIPDQIRSLTFYKAVSPLSRPIADATHEISEIAFLVARIELESGVIGEGYLLAFHYSPEAIAGALRDIHPMVIGKRASEPGRFIQEFEKEAEYFGHSGIHRWSLGIINIAMWDAWTRSLQQPIWRVLGAYHTRVPVYGSGGWISYSIEELIDEVTRYAKRGFKAVKIKVGSPTLEQDLERLSKVREAVGTSLKIMMDANQGLDLPRALALAKAAQPLQIHWFEEPLNHQDFDGYQYLRQNAGISLAMGEREFDTLPLRELISRKAIDLWQPDLLRLGSVEAWRASAFVAHAHHIPVLPHYYKEYDVPLLMTIPNPYGSESFDWVDGLLTRPLRIEDGYAYPHETPGWGFEFKTEKLHAL